MKKAMKWIFPFLALSLLLPLSTACAHNRDAEVVSGQDAVQLEATDPSATPCVTPFEESPDGIPADAVETETTNVTVTLGPIQRLESFQPIKEGSDTYEVQTEGAGEMLAVTEQLTPQLRESQYDIEHQISLRNEAPGIASRVALRVALLTTREPYQLVASTDISPNGHKITEDKYGNAFAEFNFSNVRAGQEIPVNITYHLTVSPVSDDLELGEDPAPANFLKPEPLIESNRREIVDLARQLTKDKPSPREKVRAIYDWIGDNISYTGYSPEDRGALFALQNRGGDCTEFSYLLIALCRAAGIPARFVQGLTYVPGTARLSGSKHDWVEVHLPDIGWVPVDPTWGAFNEAKDQYFARMSSDHIIVTTGNPALMAKLYTRFHYFEYYYWGGSLSHAENWQIQRAD